MSETDRKVYPVATVCLKLEMEQEIGYNILQ